VRLRRFSQLGWQGCQDLAGFVMGEKVERVELGPAPDNVATFKASDMGYYHSVEDMIDVSRIVLGQDR
jgi:hypothetical protein